jgi:hypothetical protein
VRPRGALLGSHPSRSLLAEIVRLDRAHRRPVAGDSELAELVKVAARAHQTMIRTNHAGGRPAYQRFWDAISKITVADVRGIPPDSAPATLSYKFNDGRVIRERTAYGLVNEGGRLKINSSTVLSSVTL